MFTIPAWALKSTPADKMDELLEWRLDARDVAHLTGSTVMTVCRWVTSGRHGALLASRRFSEAATAPRAFRLVDVQNFGHHADVFVDLTKLHPVLARDWGIDISGSPAKVGSNE